MASVAASVNREVFESGMVDPSPVPSHLPAADPVHPAPDDCSMGEGHDRTKGREERRQAILDVARDVFLRDGYAAASMSAIAARVGGSKGTLYNYFPSKEALFIAVIDNACAVGQSRLFAFYPRGDDLREALRRFGERYVQLMLSDEVITLHRLVTSESIRFPEIGRILYEAGPRRGHARLTTYVQALVDGGLLHADDPAKAAEQLTELYLAGLYRKRLWGAAPEPDAAVVQANVETAIDTFLAAYGAERRSPG